MEPELVFSHQVGSIGGNRGNAAFAGKGIAPGHLKAGGHFYVKIISAIPLEDLKEFKIIGKNNEPFALFPDSPDQIKAFIAVSGGDDPGKIGISLGGFDQEDRPSFFAYEFAAHDRSNAHFLDGLEKKD